MMRRLWATVGVLLCLFSAALAEITPLPIDASPGLAYNWEKYGDDLHYEDPSLYIDVQEGELYGTRYMYAIVKIADPSQLRTAFAYKYNSGYTVSAIKMATSSQAVLAINGDFYSWRDSGYLVRQGRVYRRRPAKKYDLLMIDNKGDFYTISEPTSKKIEQWQTDHPDLKIINSFNFGPILIVDGEKTHDTFQDVGIRYEARVNDRVARMVLCQLDTPLSYLVVCCQGQQDGEGIGLTINEMYECIRTIEAKHPDLNVKVAYCLDGGHSTTMVLNGEKINYPENGVLRNISDIIYFASACTEE